MPSLKKNLVYNIAYQILILIVPFITSPYVSRVLGPEGVGIYSVTTAVVKYFTLFALLGMANYGNRTIAKNRTNRKELSVTFWNLYYFQLIVSSIVLLLYSVYIVCFGYSLYGIICLCQIPYMMSAVFEVSWFFYGMEQFKSIVIRNAIVKVLTTISIFIFVNARNDVWIYVLINALSLLIGQLCLWPFIRKYVSWEKPVWSLIKSHLKPNCVLMVSVIAVSIYTLMSKIMLEWLSNTQNVGYFENTEKILTIANNAAGAIGIVMLPRVSNLRAMGDDNQVIKYVDKSMNYIMIIAMALAFGIAGISECFSVVYFGQEFEICGKLLLTISPAIIFYAWSNILRNQYLLPNDRDKVFVAATILAAILNLVVNFICIPAFGALGAVFGVLAAQLGELVYQSVCVRQELPLCKYLIRTLPYIVIGLLMFCLCKGIEMAVGISIITLLLQISLGGILYVVLAGGWLWLKRDELILGIIHKANKRW